MYLFIVIKVNFLTQLARQIMLSTYYTYSEWENLFPEVWDVQSH
jgi:hypothetical protein